MASGAYDVIVSYARADSRHAAEIDAVLRSKGVSTFFDRRELTAGLPWVRALEQAIGAAKAAIVLIGPRGLGNTQHYESELRSFGKPPIRPDPLARLLRSHLSQREKETPKPRPVSDTH